MGLASRPGRGRCGGEGTGKKMAKVSLRLWVLIGIALLLTAGVVLRFVLAGGDTADDSDPAAARIQRYQREGNIAALASECSSNDVEVARKAVTALGYSGPAAASHIERAMRDKRAGVREAAAAALGRAVGRDRTGRLAEAASRDKSANVRATAVTALGRVLAYNEMETLIAALGDEDVTVRHRANEAITRITGLRFKFRANDPAKKRREVIRTIRKAWPKMKAWVSYYHESQPVKQGP